MLSACVVAPYPARRVVYSQPVPTYAPAPVYAPQPVEEPEYIVDVPPPALYGEAQPLMPFPGAVWIGGYWGWGGGRHAWVPGRWDRPRPGYAWRPHAWVPEGGRWRLQGGGWVRR